MVSCHLSEDTLYMGTGKFNSGGRGNLAMDWHAIQGGGG